MRFETGAMLYTIFTLTMVCPPWGGELAAITWTMGTLLAIFARQVVSASVSGKDVS